MKVRQPTAEPHGANAKNDEEGTVSDFDPERVRLSRCSRFRPSSLEAVAEAISVATEYEKRVYVAARLK